MSRTIITKNGGMIFYIDDYEDGSYGYLINYKAGDKSKGCSFQCKIKVIEYMIFGTAENSKKYFMNLKYKYPEKTYHRFVIHNLHYEIVVCVKEISNYEPDLFTQNEIQELLLYGYLKTKRIENEMITFNDDRKKRGF